MAWSDAFRIFKWVDNARKKGADKMRGLRLKRLCLGSLASVLLVVCLSGCLASKNKEVVQRAYYLKVGEPAPIEGWLINAQDMSDLLVSSIKNERGEK